MAIKSPEKIVEATASVFLRPHLPPTSVAPLIRGMSSAIDKRIDLTKTVILPSGDTPLEFPLVVFSDTEGLTKLTISQVRLDYSQQCHPTDSETAIELGTFFNEAIEILQSVLETCDASVFRFAAIVKRVSIREPNYAKELAKHFCQKRWTDNAIHRPDSFELHAHKCYETPSGMKANSWIRNRSATLVTGQSSSIVDQDINTVQEVEYTANEIPVFFASIANELDHVLALYYPQD